MSANRTSIRMSMSESGIRITNKDFQAKVKTLAEETVSSLNEIWQSAGREFVYLIALKPHSIT